MTSNKGHGQCPRKRKLSEISMHKVDVECVSFILIYQLRIGFRHVS